MGWRGVVGGEGIYMSVDDTETIECPFCAERISRRAKKCRHCSEIIDPALREIENLKNKGSNIIISNNNAATSATHDAEERFRGDRTKTAALLWCFFLGAFGAHKFYLGRPGWGLLYLIFFWTFVPAVIAFVEFILLILTSERDFDRKYNR